MSQSLSHLEKRLDNRVAWVDLQNLLLVLVELVGAVIGLGIRLCLHDALHVARPSVRIRNQRARGLDEAVRHNSLRDRLKVEKEVCKTRRAGVRVSIGM